MSKPTLLYLHPHFTLNGGAGKFVLETSQRLAKRDFRCKVVSIKANQDITGPYRKDVEFVDIGGPLSSSLWFWITFPYVFWKVYQVVSKEPDAIIFAQVFPANWWGFLIKLLHPERKVVWMCQEPSAFIHSPLWIKALPSSIVKFGLVLLLPLLKVLDVFLAQHVDAVIGNSKYTTAQARKVYHYSSDKIQTIYLGIDLSTFKNLGLKRRQSVITVSRLSKFKNIDLIIKAVWLLNQNRKVPITLEIIGDGEAKQELESAANSYTKFLGHVAETAEVVKHLNHAKLFVMASINEPFGLAPIEAMACGTPAVVSNSGGLLETVNDGQTGYYFEGGDDVSLSRCIESIIDSQAKFNRLSRAAEKHAQSFSWDKTVLELEKLFLKL